MAIDFGDIFGAALGAGLSAAGQQFVGPLPPTALPPAMSGGPPALARAVAAANGTKKCRRRRRRLLTPTDLSDLAALQALVGKGSAALNMAVAKAVRR